MKRKLSIILVILFYILMPVMSNAQNLIRNSHFSEVDGLTISDWAKGKNNPEYFTLTAKDNILCIENNITNYSEVSQSVKVLPNKYYKISAKVKVTKSSSSGAYIMVKVLDEAVKSKSEIVDVKSTDWEEITMYGKTEDNQYAICVNLCLGEKDKETQGKAYFKDVTLEEIDYVPKNYSKWYISDINAGEKAILINLFSKLGLVSFCMFLVWCMVKCIKNNTLGEVDNQKMGKKDAIIMGVLTLVYLALALYNLGDKVAPQTGWYPKEKGEYVIIKLPKMTHIEKITYYEGLNSQESNKGAIKLQYLDGDLAKDDGIERYHILMKKGFDNFKWKQLNEDATASLVKLELLEEGIDLREIAIYEKGSKNPLQGLKILEDKTKNHVGKNLIDEQQYAQYEDSHKNRAIFDEICYPRTGYEYLNNMKGFEATHPPLGKIFVAFGIKMFGMTPFGWRIIGTLFGVAMVPIMYLFSKKLFKERIYAILGATLIMFDCMHFVQTRTSLIDSYSVLFIILMYYYMTDIYTSSEQKVTKKYVKSLMLSGLFFSLGVATKWIVVYGGAGLCVMYFISLYKNLKQSKKEVLKSMGLATLLFVVLPILVYLVVYIPVLRPNGYTLHGVFNEVKSMFLFHKDEVIEHPYSSAWYEWFFMIKPMTFYYNVYDNGLISKIITVGNPLIWWISLASIVFAAIIGTRKKDNIIWIFVIGYIFQYLPWIFIKRTIFIYHYFSAVPFAIFAIVYMLKNLYDDRKEIYKYVAMVVTTFIVFYPKLSGLPVEESYDHLVQLMCIFCVFWIAHYLNAVLKKIL